MPNDAKLGLVAGVALVIAVAVVYFHNDLTAAKTRGDAAAATVVSPTAGPPVQQRNASRTTKGKTMSVGTQEVNPAPTAQMPKAPEDEGDAPQP